MWGLMGVEAALAVRAARQNQEREFAAHRRVAPRVDHTLHPGDCPSCGSQEFRLWRGTSVCSYCRSTAQAVAPRPARVSDAYEANLAEAKIRMLQEYQRFAVRDTQRQYARLTTD